MLNNEEGVVYAPYIFFTTGTIINNVKVWDYRWWVNIWCRINWFFHFRMRRRWKQLRKKNISTNYYKLL